MLVHCIYLGHPTRELLEKTLKILTRHKNPARQQDGRPYAILWTLNSTTQNVARRILETIPPSAHPPVHLKIRRSTEALSLYAEETIKEETTARLRTIEETQVYRAATKMLSAYFNILNTPNVTVREFVTGKELLALWIAYTYGGIILDAGCDVYRDSWDLSNLNSEIFYVPGRAGSWILGKMGSPLLSPLENIPRDKKSHLYFVSILSLLRTEAETLDFDSGDPHLKFSTPAVDNWILVSPQWCFIPLFALRMHLLFLPAIYKTFVTPFDDFIQIDGGLQGQGRFATLSAIISINAIVDGYISLGLDGWPFVTIGASKPIKYKHHPVYNVSYLNFERALLLEAPRSPGTASNIIYLPSGLNKTVTQITRSADGRIINGWRAVLSPDQCQQVLDRYNLFSAQWMPWWDLLQSNMIYTFR